MQVSATISAETAKKLNITPSKVTTEVNIPDTLAEKVKLFGEEVVNSAASDALVINVQAGMRRMMVPKFDKAGKVTTPPSTTDQIVAWVKTWKPDVRTVVRQSAFEKAKSSLSVMSADERKALLAELQKASAPQPTVKAA